MPRVDIDTFDMKQACQSTDASATIHAFFELLCDKYQKRASNFHKKHVIARDARDVFDTHELTLLDASLTADRRMLDNLRLALDETCEDLDRVVQRRLEIVDILSHSYDDNVELLQVIQGKLYKLQLIHVLMTEQSAAWVDAANDP